MDQVAAPQDLVGPPALAGEKKTKGAAVADPCARDLWPWRLHAVNRCTPGSDRWAVSREIRNWRVLSEDQLILWVVAGIGHAIDNYQARSRKRFLEQIMNRIGLRRAA